MNGYRLLGQAVQRPGSRRFHPAPAGLVVLLVMLAVPTRALAQPAVLYDGPFVFGPAPAPCVATDVITLTGRMVITFYARTDGSSGTHFTFRIVTKAQGSSADPLNPKKYVMNDEEVTDTNIPSGGSYENTQLINQGIIRQGETIGDNIPLGSGDDFMAKTTIHMTVSASGIPAAMVNDIRFACM